VKFSIYAFSQGLPGDEQRLAVPFLKPILYCLGYKLGAIPPPDETWNAQVPLVFISVYSSPLTNEGKKLFTFCPLHSSAREINSSLLHAHEILTEDNYKSTGV
jgi:hypothetical protein